MVHHKEAPPDVQIAAAELGNRVLNAMSEWARETGVRVDARAPIAALQMALGRVLDQVAPEQRKTYARDFSRALLERVGLTP